jgi:hypothetical protein
MEAWIGEWMDGWVGGTADNIVWETKALIDYKREAEKLS